MTDWKRHFENKRSDLKKKSKKLHNYIKDRWRRILSSYEPKKIYDTPS